jgi:regulatory protein
VKNETDRAKNYCFRLFKIRPRSEAELRQKLKQKKYPPELVDACLDYFKKIGLINDFEFARFWISSRINRPLGLRRLFYELKFKGIPEELSKEAARPFKEAQDEPQIVRELARKKMKQLKEKDRYKARSKVYAFLMRKGFSPEAVIEALEEQRSLRGAEGDEAIPKK